jgi:hypothetical protein
LSGELQMDWWKALQVRPCLSCRKSEECYRQRCRMGSSQTVRATERRLVGEAKCVRRWSNGAVEEKTRIGGGGPEVVTIP